MAKKIDDNKQDIISVETASQLVGLIPPQALDVEEAVLGAVMLEKNAILSIQDILRPESFYNEANRIIFQAILNLSAELKPIDLLTISQELQRKEMLSKVGGSSYLTKLVKNIGSAAHIEFHAKIVAQKYIQRQLIAISTEIQKRSFSDEYDVEDLIGLAESKIFAIAEGNIKRDVQSAKSIVALALAKIQEASKKEDGLSGVPSGFTNIDRLTMGWQPSDLIIIAARPSMGKTAFVLSIARNITIDHKRAVAFFSLEMSSIQLIMRLIMGESGLESNKIKNGRLSPDEWTHLTNSIKQLENAQLFIDDTPALSIFEFRSKVRRLKMQHNIELIVIDYLQLMTTGASESKGNREQEVAMISRSLKAISKELDIPILALSQLNRSVESRGGSRRPQLSDLRESGAIEQDADIVAFIHRPEYYGLLQDEEGNSTQGLAEIIFAKHRNGAVGIEKLRFRAEQAKFVDWDDSGFTSASAGYTEVASTGFNTEGLDELSMAQGRVAMANNDANLSDIPF